MELFGSIHSIFLQLVRSSEMVHGKPIILLPDQNVAFIVASFEEGCVCDSLHLCPAWQFFADALTAEDGCFWEYQEWGEVDNQDEEVSTADAVGYGLGEIDYGLFYHGTIHQFVEVHLIK